MIQRSASERDEANSGGEHQRDEKVVAAGELAYHDERRQRHVCQAAVERPHADESKCARVDARIVQKQLGGASESTTKYSPDDERGTEVAGASARADREGSREHLREPEQQKELDASPSPWKPRSSSNGHLRRTVAAPENSEAHSAPPKLEADE